MKILRENRLKFRHICVYEILPTSFFCLNVRRRRLWWIQETTILLLNRPQSFELICKSRKNGTTYTFINHRKRSLKKNVKKYTKWNEISVYIGFNIMVKSSFCTRCANAFSYHFTAIFCCFAYAYNRAKKKYEKKYK